jgi:pyrroline-5-carboxylate reductase
MSKKESSVAIIGGGNLGMAIAEGLVEGGFMKPSSITVTRRTVAALKPLAEKKLNITSNNLEAVKAADIVILAVKPFQVLELMKEISRSLKSNQVLVSVITGVSLIDLQGMVKKPLALFRAMPNTAIAIQQSMTCISYVNANEQQVAQIAAIFNVLGKTAVIDDKLMDAATVLGACGTAYAMRYIRANIQGGIEIGFSAATASLIAAQTVKGAAELLLTKGTHPEQEIDKVTTPKGCTIAGLNEMEHQGFSSSLIKGISSSYQKIVKG